MISPFLHGQTVTPAYLGDANWHAGSRNAPREPFQVTPHVFPLEKRTTADSSGSISRQTIRPGTVVLHEGPTQPVIQTCKITGKKLQPPGVFSAPPLLYRENTRFNLSYTDSRHGFAGKYTTEFVEDDAHHIWMGTENGLIRYDGSHYYVYNQSNGLPDLPEPSVLLDQQNRLWVASESGVYYIKNDSLFTIQISGLDFSGISCSRLFLDRFQRIWLCTYNNGAICIEGNKVSIYDNRCGLPENNVKSFLLDSKGNLFMGMANQGLVMIEPNRMKHFFSKPKMAKTFSFLCLYEDNNGIWAGTYKEGLIMLGRKDTVRYSVNGKFSERVFDIKKAPGGIWFCCFGDGLAYFGNNKLLLITDNNGLGNKHAYRIFEDSFENLWIANGQSGFGRLNENIFYQEHYSNKQIGFVKKSITDGKHRNWLLSYGTGIVYREKPSANGYQTATNLLNGPLKYINDGILNPDGSLWLGTYGFGIGKIDDKQLTAYTYFTTPENGIVLSIKRDSSGHIWFCPNRLGLIQKEGEQFWHYTQKSGLLSNHVQKLFLDAQKRLYCSFSDGLQRFNGPDIETFFIGRNRFNDQVNELLVLDQERYLMATVSKGLLLVNKGKVYQFSDGKGVNSNHINNINKDGAGNIWLSTEEGIERFRLSGIQLSGHRMYNQSNGPFLADIKFAVDDTTANPYWSEREYKMVYDSAFEQKKPKKPFFSYTGIATDSGVISAGEPISILPNQKIDIAYQTIYWGRENNLSVTYQLISEKQDTTERTVPINGSIIIKDVLPGKYKILLKAVYNNALFYSAPLEFTVREFWYNTWVFRIFFGCLVLAGLIYYFRSKAREQQMINARLEKKVQEQTAQLLKEKEALLESNQTIYEQNKEKDVLIQEINHRVKNNLQFMIAMLDMQLQSGLPEEANNAIRSTSNRMNAMALVHEMLYSNKKPGIISVKKYIDELVKHYQDMGARPMNPIGFEIEADELLMNVKPAISLGMIISELVSNSFKHAFANTTAPMIRIRLSYSPETNMVELVVSDNGNGIPKEPNAHIGLGNRLINIFSRELDGEYLAENRQGYFFKLSFPLPKFSVTNESD